MRETDQKRKDWVSESLLEYMETSTPTKAIALTVENAQWGRNHLYASARKITMSIIFIKRVIREVKPSSI